MCQYRLCVCFVGLSYISLITVTKIISKLSEYYSVSMQVSTSEDFIVYSNHENTMFFILKTVNTVNELQNVYTV